MTHPFHISMNDAPVALSLAITHQLVGNCSRSAQEIVERRNPQKTKISSRSLSWQYFSSHSSQDVAKSSKPLTNSQISCYGSNSATATSCSKDDVGVVQSANLVQTLSYYPYGGIRISVSTSTNVKRKFINRFADDSGLDYLQARYYEASRGQFLSQDPTFFAIGNPSQLQQLSKQEQAQFLMNPQQLNSYNYAKDNPIINKDPDGSFAFGIPLYYGAVTAPEWAPAVWAGVVAAGAYITADISLRGNGWGSRWGGTVRTADLTRGSGLNQNPMGPEDWDPKNFDKASTWMKALTIGGFAAGGVEAFGKPIYEMYQSLNNRGPQAAQQLNQQFNSSSVQTRVQATQAYNAASGASSPQQQLWVTPNGAVVNWGGGVVAPASQSNSKK